MFVVFGRKLGAVLDVVTGVFIFVLFSAMLAGAGAAGDQAFGLPFSLGAFALAALCFCVLLFDFKGIMEINTIITPILIIGAVGLGILAIFSSYTPVQEASQNVSLMPLSATVYAAYNMIPAIAVLAALQAAVPTRGVARAGGVLGGFFVAVVGLILAVALLLNLPVVANAELPMLALAGSIEPWVYYAYTAIIFLAIFTTAATNAFALIRWLEARTRFTKMQLKILICTLGVTAAHFGFSAMVSYAYTAFGFLGLFIITAIIVRFFRNK
ncbi:MAG: hypothetical protein FWB74_06535, partial [Defluviitaleaceae bacterium]|nr:hypothetical protein [Defluviitaleaceae bacterium]